MSLLILIDLHWTLSVFCDYAASSQDAPFEVPITDGSGSSCRRSFLKNAVQASTLSISNPNISLAVRSLAYHRSSALTAWFVCARSLSVWILIGGRLSAATASLMSIPVS